MNEQEFLEQQRKREERYQTLMEVEKNIHRKEITLNTNNYVVMANNMILHSASNLSLDELKLLRFIIMQTEKGEKELFEFSITAKDLAKVLEVNIKTKDLYKRLQTMAKHIMQEVIHIGDDSKNKWIMFHWVDVCRYDKGTLAIKISDELKPFLVDLRGSFTRYQLSEIVSFKSIYAIRLYEILNGYLNDNNLPHADVSIEISISIDELRKSTSTENKFERYSSFKQRVIDTALREINDKSKYYVTATPYKRNQKVVGFDFLIESQAGHAFRTSNQAKTIKIKNDPGADSGQMSLSDFID